jgi:hypothetical protein
MGAESGDYYCVWAIEAVRIYGTKQIFEPVGSRVRFWW